ncbi:putative bifunctional diguanylate cyclase/phosphodiesterase [Streptomyces sp. NPDC001070]
MRGSPSVVGGPARDFANAWSRLLRSGPGLALPPLTLRQVAATTADLLSRALGEPTCDTSLAEQAGTLLVEAHFTEPEILADAVALLQIQPADPERVPAVTGAFASGWASALRERTLREQEAIQRAAFQAREDAERARRASEARFRALFEHAAIGIGIADVDGTIVQVNQALRELLGARPEDLQGRRVTELVHPEDAPGVWEAYDDLVNGRRERFQCDKPYYRRDGEVVWTHLTVSLIRDEHGEPRYQVAMVEDITDRYRLQERLRHQATHDPLTGLPNRTAFFERLERLFEEPQPGARFGLCYVDLDGFKVVNDSLGHETGDQLLTAVAERLDAALAPLGHLVARLGGDEFVVLLEECRGEQEAVAVAKLVLTTLSRPFLINDQQLTIGASVGVFARRVAATTPGAAVRAADLTLYRSKEAGRGRWTLFDPTHNARAVSRYAISVRLPVALDRGEFYIDYQPLCSLADGSLVAVEALVRWRHPQFGVLGPDEFVATAEETGLIMPLGRWILERAVGQAAAWVRRYGEAAPQINVNLAVRQIRNPGLVHDVTSILAGTGLAAGRLELEITESAVIGPEDESLRALQSLAEAGVSLAVDDFGTGWSNLAYLRDLPVSGLKIAGAFVTDPHRAGTDDPVGWRIVGGLVSLAHALGLTVTAEGVENSQHARRLRSLGCDWGQGWYFGRPMRPERIARWIERGHPE